MIHLHDMSTCIHSHAINVSASSDDSRVRQDLLGSLITGAKEYLIPVDYMDTMNINPSDILNDNGFQFAHLLTAVLSFTWDISQLAGGSYVMSLRKSLSLT